MSFGQDQIQSSPCTTSLKIMNPSFFLLSHLFKKVEIPGVPPDAPLDMCLQFINKVKYLLFNTFLWSFNSFLRGFLVLRGGEQRKQMAG